MSKEEAIEHTVKNLRENFEEDALYNFFKDYVRLMGAAVDNKDGDWKQAIKNEGEKMQREKSQLPAKGEEE